VFAQNTIEVRGVVRNEKGQVLARVLVSQVGLAAKTSTDESGKYTLTSRLQNFSLSYKLLGYQTEVIKFSVEKGQLIQQDVVLHPKVEELKTVEIRQKENELRNAQEIQVKDLLSLPSVSMNFESILKTLPGVSTNNELSSQYSVRGGNFDENLIYVNDVEINRPVLVRNGQQEGLSFINPDLVGQAYFSAGGFGARYDDKLASVLDVKYKQPDSNQTIISGGLMGLSLTTKLKFKQSYLLFGYRRKDNRSILSTQDQSGSYRPSFNDLQAVYQYDLSDKFSVNLLANFNTGRFQLIPESRETLFGTIDKPIRLNIDYLGKEIDDYRTAGGALTAAYHPNANFSLKWINSFFDFSERERFDIEGNYVFEEIDNSQSIGGFGAVKKNRGLGTYFSHARNQLETYIAATQLKISHQIAKHSFTYGIKAEQSSFNDQMNEYSFIDSAGYILPVNSHSFTFQNLVQANNQLKMNTFSGYLQDNIQLTERSNFQLGFRLCSSSLTNELLFSPRIQYNFRPNENHNWRFTAGVYQQMPSYRSIRFADGTLFLGQKPQRSYNASVAYDMAFIGLGTRLKFTSELYYKYFDRMIPYTVDNVRIKYLANQLTVGNTFGADFSIGGELVKDLMSHFRISFLQANQRSISGQSNSYQRRPSDQRVNVSLFFQDRLFRSPTYKVHLNLLYGSRLPVGSPFVSGYSDDFTLAPYRRVDIGFSTDFLDKKRLKPVHFLSNYFSSVIAYAEVFNLLNINNTVSYLWLRDVDWVSYAIPNYLTMRQLNFKLIFKFK
jgi:hypothetical protein